MTSWPTSPWDPTPTTPSPPPPTTRPRPPSTRACAGWSTSTAPRKPGWPCGWCCPAPSTRPPWTCSWWSVSPPTSRPTAPPELADLLDAHHFTDGLAFLTAGTPTNNSGAERAGYASRDRRGEQSFAVEWPESTPAGAPELGPASGAGHLGAALGLAAPRIETTLGRIAGAGEGDEIVAEAMQTALWPATWGYYLSQFTTLDDGRAELDPRPRPSPPAPGRCAAGAALRSSALRRAGRHVARRLVGHRGRRRTQRPPRQPAGDAARPGVAAGDRRRRTGRAQRRSRRRRRRRAPRRAHQRRLPRAPGARSALPDAPAPLARPGPRRDRFLRRPAPAHIEPARPRRRARSGRSRPVRVRGRQLPARRGPGPWLRRHARLPRIVARCRPGQPRRCRSPLPSRCCRRWRATPCCASTPRRRPGCSRPAGATPPSCASTPSWSTSCPQPSPPPAGPGSAPSRSLVPSTARPSPPTSARSTTSPPPRSERWASSVPRSRRSAPPTRPGSSACSPPPSTPPRSASTPG